MTKKKVPERAEHPSVIKETDLHELTKWAAGNATGAFRVECIDNSLVIPDYRVFFENPEDAVLHKMTKA